MLTRGWKRSPRLVAGAWARGLSSDRWPLEQQREAVENPMTWDMSRGPSRWHLWSIPEPSDRSCRPSWEVASFRTAPQVGWALMGGGPLALPPDWGLGGGPVGWSGALCGLCPARERWYLQRASQSPWTSPPVPAPAPPAPGTRSPPPQRWRRSWAPASGAVAGWFVLDRSATGVWRRGCGCRAHAPPGRCGPAPPRASLHLRPFREWPFMLFVFSAPVLTGLFDSRRLSDAWPANVFSQSVACVPSVKRVFAADFEIVRS